MKSKISFFLITIALISFFYTHPAHSEQQEEISLSAFSRTYGKTLGNLSYNSFFDFNRNNSIDNDNLKVCLSTTPLKALIPFLSVSKKSDRRKKSSKGIPVPHLQKKTKTPWILIKMEMSMNKMSI